MHWLLRFFCALTSRFIEDCWSRSLCNVVWRQIPATMVSSHNNRGVFVETKALKFCNISIYDFPSTACLLNLIFFAWIFRALKVPIKNERTMGSHKMDKAEASCIVFIMNRQTIVLEFLIILKVIFVIALRRHINLVIRKFPHHTHVEVLGVIPEAGLKHPRHISTERRLVENAQRTKNIKLVF